jgi:tetratricopeptide (TPR) repeat protein
MDFFNHAIVYAPGAPDYWLDLTDPDVRPGVIAPNNQGRWSLVARPSTNNLVHVPELSAEENRAVETREFVLPELGKARIVETSEAYGPANRTYRASFGSRSDKELRDSLKSYVDSTYGEAKISRIAVGDADDLSKPFTLRIELEDAQRGVAARTEAAVGIFVPQIAARLPRFFREDQPAGKGDEAKEEPQRAQDFEIAEPFIQEWRYKFTVPAGFRVSQLPEAKQEMLGIATLSTKFQRDSDTQISAELVFRMPKKRFSASEGLKLRDALVELGKSKPLLIFFDQVGETALAEGKVKEALAEFETLRKLHPAEALHSLQYARALLAAGAAESARAEARRAVQLEPTSATGWVQLAEVLKHDMVGRPLEKGMDQDGAVEAYRKALDLDAIIMKREPIWQSCSNTTVTVFAMAAAPGCEILDKLGGFGVAQNYPVALLRANRAQQLRDYLRKQPDSELNQTLAVCAEAILNGSKAALDRAG